MKIFYYSKENKIKTLNLRYVILLLIPFAVLISLSYSLVQHIFFSSTSVLQRENKKLKENLDLLNNKFSLIKNNLNDLYFKERKLRIASNIQLSNNGEFGVGGSEPVFSGFFNTTESKLQNYNKLADEIINQLSFQSNNFNNVEKKLSDNLSYLLSVPSIEPMKGVYSEHGFGMRLHPIYKQWKMHEGIDILGNTGDPIYATADGKIVSIGNRGGYGMCIEIDHGYGYTTLYGHLSKVSVIENQKINRFQKIGECGTTGLSTGPHLHYEVSYNGEKKDPMNYIFN